MKIILVPH